MGLLDSLVADRIEQCDIFALLYINKDIYVKINDKGVYGPYSSVELQVPGVLYASAYSDIERSNQGGVLTSRGLEVLTSDRDRLKGVLADAIKSVIDINDSYRKSLKVGREESYTSTSVLTIGPRTCNKSSRIIQHCEGYLDVIIGDILDSSPCLGIWDRVHMCWAIELECGNRCTLNCAKELSQHDRHE